MCTYFKAETEDYSLRKKYGGTRLVSEKAEVLYTQNLTNQWKQPIVVILQQANFYDIFILSLWLRIMRISNQGV